MGGKALKNVITRRYNPEEYNIIIDKVLTGLDMIIPDERKSSIPHLKFKKSFGDLDLLVTKPIEYKKALDAIIDYFEPKEYLENGSVFSFDFEEFQVDLIFTTHDLFDMAKVYYSNNDAGMLIGRMAHQLGLKYGSEGLKLHVYSDDNSNRLGVITLSKNPWEIFDVLDLDFKRYKEGFNDHYELYNYLTTSKYFYYYTFDDGLIRSEDRRRDNKRASIHIFKEWLEENKSLFKEKIEPLSKEDKMTLYETNFPDLNIKRKVNMMYLEHHKKKIIHEKWNGHHILGLYPEMDPIDLGFMINGFKNYMNYDNPDAYFNFIWETSYSDIVIKFKEFYNYQSLIEDQFKKEIWQLIDVYNKVNDNKYISDLTVGGAKIIFDYILKNDFTNIFDTFKYKYIIDFFNRIESNK